MRTGRGHRLQPRFVLLTSLVAWSCAPPRPVETALHGDLQQLREELAGDAQPALGAEQLNATAQAVLRRELSTASQGELPQRLAQLDSCVLQVAPLLEEAVAPPTLRAVHVIGYARTRLGLDLRAAFTKRKADEDPVHSLVTQVLRATSRGRAPMRQEALLHPELSVRIAAALSAWIAGDPRDVSSLADAARRDPSPAVRELALHALGRVPSESAVRALLELSPSIDEERVALLAALAGEGAGSHGGLEALSRLMYRGQGDELDAALVLYQRAGGELRERAARQILRALDGSSSTQLVVALRLIPGDVPGTLERFEQLAQHEEPLVAALALSRLAQQRALHPEERKRLTTFASAEEKEKVPALLAQALLALQGEPVAVERLRQVLTSKYAQHRSLSALALLQSPAASKAQVALADDSPAVRTQVACAVLAQSQPEQAASNPSPVTSVVPEQLDYLRWLPPVPQAVVDELAARANSK